MGKGQVQVGPRDKHIAKPQYVRKQQTLGSMSRPHQTGFRPRMVRLNL